MVALQNMPPKTPTKNTFFKNFVLALIILMLVSVAYSPQEA
jgi:hypothetical protein